MPTRIVAARPTTLEVEFRDDDGALVDPGTVTVAAVRDNGDTQTIAADVDGTGAAARTVALTAAEVGDTPDLLTVTWTSASQGTRTQHVEVVGGWIVEIGDVRGDDLPAAIFSAAQLRRARDWFEEVAEDFCWAFRPRYRRHTFVGDGTTMVVLPNMYIRQVVWATIDGTTVTTSEWEFHDSGLLCANRTFPRGVTVEVGYRHGWDHPPPHLVDVGILAVREVAGKGDRRTSSALSVTSQSGAVTRNSVPSVKYPTGIPDVDAVLTRIKGGT